MSIRIASNTSDLLCFIADVGQMVAQETSPSCPRYLCQLWRPCCAKWRRGSRLVRRPDSEACRGRKPEGAAPPCQDQRTHVLPAGVRPRLLLRQGGDVFSPADGSALRACRRVEREEHRNRPA